MSKAITLPINVLVVVVIAVVVILGLASTYGVGFNPFSSALGLESVKNTGCRQLVMGGCKTNTSLIHVNYDVNGDNVNDTQDNLLALCIKFFGRSDDLSCRQMCGCAGTMNTTGGGNGGPCTPNCAGKVCGSNGCGGSCGNCLGGQSCNANGQCVACVPNCAGKQCGPNGCSGSCGTCTPPQTCNAAGQCIACVPRTCAQLGKQCGTWNNGCGGTVTCPTCSGGQLCNANGQCVGCIPNCAGKVCGYDGCGPLNNNCGTCTGGRNCNAVGQCVFGPVNCDWIRLMCGSDPSCILCCYDTNSNPEYEETCGPAGCVGGVCIIGQRRCTSITC